MAEIRNNQIIFDHRDWTAGFAKNNAALGINNPSNQLVSKFDPFRQYGVAQPGRLGVNATNNAGLGGAIVAMALKNNTTAYGVDYGGKVHEYNYSTNTLTTGSYPYTITGTTPVGQDAIIYKHNSAGVPVFSTFYSYYNTANWNVGAIVNHTGAPADTFMSATPATPLDITTVSPADGKDVAQINAPHPMEVGADDVLYILSGRYLHAYDGANGTNGTFTSRVLTLPQGFTGTSLVKYQDKLLIAGSYVGFTGVINSDNVGSAGEAMVYVWNYTDLDISQVIPLDDPYVFSVFSWRGRPCVISIGESEGFGSLAATKLKIINGNTAEKVAEFTGIVSHRGVDSSSRVLYVNTNGKIYAIGDNLKDGYNVNHVMSCVSTGQPGFIKNLVENSLIASSSTASVHSMSKFGNTDSYDTAALYTCYYNVPLPEGKIARIRSVQVEYYGTVTNAGRYLTVELATDIDASFQINTNAVSNLATVAAPAQKLYSKNYLGAPYGQFSSISLHLVWNDNGGSTSAVKVTKVIVNYELINLGA